MPADREFRLLLACSRVRPDADTCALQESLAAGLDEQAFLALVDRHRVAPLVWANLSRHAPGVFSAGLLAALSARHRANAFRTLAVTGETLSLHRLLEGVDLPDTMLKGVSLALRYYGETALRHVGDIDLLVGEADFARACQLLESAGYVPTDPLARLGDRQRRYFMATNHDYEFTLPQAPTIIELHWHTMVDTAPERLGRQQVAGCDLPVLADEEMLLYLCAHGAEHAWFRLKWAFDLPQLLEDREWNWPELFRKARRYRCEPSFALGLLVANRLLGWQIPAPANDWLRDRRGLEAQYSFVLRALHGPESWWSGHMPMAMLPRWFAYRIRLLQGAAAWRRELKWLATTRRDWDMLPLPDALFFLYFPLRPFLLLWRRIRRK